MRKLVFTFFNSLGFSKVFSWHITRENQVKNFHRPDFLGCIRLLFHLFFLIKMPDNMWQTAQKQLICRSSFRNGRNPNFQSSLFSRGFIADQPTVVGSTYSVEAWEIVFKQIGPHTYHREKCNNQNKVLESLVGILHTFPYSIVCYSVCIWKIWQIDTHNSKHWIMLGYLQI